MTDYKEVIEELDKLHEMRKTMSYYSNYHGTYVEEAIRLNNILIQLTGFSYIDHKSQEQRNKWKLKQQSA